MAETGEDTSATISNVILSPEQRLPFEEGAVILLDKSLHWTSFDVVRKLRHIIRIKKIGHAGTLDPLATGLLIICSGKFTKQINTYMGMEKEYTGTITLGAVTPTYDLESLPENHKDFSFITETDIRSKVSAFMGEQDQKPPIYSAIKKKGTPLYELARRGEEVDLQPRKIMIYSFEITAIRLPEVDFRVRCSTGTYIRSLAHDFGQTLGTGGYLSALRRTAIGEFRVEDAKTMEEWAEQWSATHDS
jgi:tRNA pseudouridine55 synthase